MAIPPPPLSVPIHQANSIDLHDPAPVGNHALAPSTSTPSPDQNLIPQDIMPGILEEIPVPTVDISNPFSILAAV